MQNGRFPTKIALRLKKSATKFLCVITVNDKVVKHYSLTDVRCLAVEKNCATAPIFARCASVVTTNEKSSINTTKKSTTRFQMSQR